MSKPEGSTSLWIYQSRNLTWVIKFYHFLVLASQMHILLTKPAAKVGAKTPLFISLLRSIITRLLYSEQTRLVQPAN